MAHPVDLKFNYPSIEQEDQLLHEYFASLLHRDTASLRSFPPYQGHREVLDAAAEWLGLTRGPYGKTVDVVACNSGNHALACILQALRNGHTTIITEPFTYPAFKTIASHNGYTLVPCDFDEHGVTVEGLEKAIDQTKSKIIYLQPTIQNPTCVVMPLQRRQAIAALAKEKELLIIEDDAYRFLCKTPPPAFLELLPENTFHIYSLSKPFTPLIKTALLTVPNRFHSVVVDSIRITSSGVSALLGDLSVFLFKTKKLHEVMEAKQDLAERLQQSVRRILQGLSYQTYPTSFHLWLKLPAHLNADNVVAALAKEGIMAPSGTDFCVGDVAPGTRFMRIALGAEKNPQRLEGALQKVSSLLNW